MEKKKDTLGRQTRKAEQVEISTVDKYKKRKQDRQLSRDFEE